MKGVSGYLRTAAMVLPMVALLPASAWAEACMTDVTVTTTDVVSGVTPGFGTALTGATLNTTSANVVNSVTQTKNPAIGIDLPGPLPTITILPANLVVTNVSSTSTDVVGSASLTTTDAQFVNSIDVDTTPVVNSVTPEYSGASGNGPTAFACGQNATATGPQASAFGNEATAFGAFTTALGGSSSAFFAFGSTAVGAGANADFSAFSSAFGANANASFSIGSTATGAGADASFSVGSTATGAGADASFSVGSTATGAGANASFSAGSTATGAGANAALSIGSTATGAASNASLSVGSTATGAFSDVSGTAFSTANGFGAQVAAGTTGGVAMGAFATAEGDNSTAVGAGAFAANSGTAIGQGASAQTFGATAVGQAAFAQGDGTAVGDNSSAERNATAVGNGAQANGNGSVAIGRDSTGAAAVANNQNEFVLGTANHTYTAPGITSGASRAAQSGPLEVVTTDKNGHLASDGGLLYNTLSEFGAGIAIAMSLENPDLVGNERFGIAANLGFFEGNVALGVSMMGVLGHNFTGNGERWALSGAVGVSLDNEEFGGHSAGSTVAGRAGVQVSW